MTLQLKANAQAPGVAFAHHWNLCVGAGRANEGLRAAWLEQMTLAHRECGFKYVRFHGLFHDDMFVYRIIDGREVFNFQYIDELFDRLLAIGIKPFVELGFCPGDLATRQGTVFWWKGNGSPPKDYAKWAELVRRFVTHVLARYGADEVRTWYFEVWNEPNLHPFFTGTKTQYFELYRTSVQVIKAIDPTLRVGGPSTSNFVPDTRFDGELEDTAAGRVVIEATDLDALDWRPVWVEQFLKWCAKEKLPVDFISCHPYPTDWALDEHATFKKSTRNVNATPADLALLRRIIDASAFPKAEIHLTEWSSSSSPRDYTHDYLQAATYIVKANIESLRSVDSLSYWTFTDIFEEGGAGDTAFHGGFGMINYQGLPKPSFHAYRFLAALGDEEIARSVNTLVTRRRSTGKLSALAYHYPPEMPLSVPASFDTRDKAEEVLALGKPVGLEIALTGLRPGAAVVIETLARGAGDVLTAWQGLGSPEPLSREQTAALRTAALATRVQHAVADAHGHFKLTLEVTPWSVVLVREV